MKKLNDAIIGFVVGDALGVPVEFKSRNELDKDPVVDMRGFGTYNQPKGTWSDDSSMTLATVESLTRLERADKYNVMRNFAAWYNTGMYTPYGKVFDIGNTTRRAIENYMRGIKPFGLSDERDNGNGALMRMLPLVFLPIPIDERRKVAREFAALTHAHERNLLVCELFVEAADRILRGVDDWLMWSYNAVDFGAEETAFSRFTYLTKLKREQIRSSGYVIDTLEAAFWCLLTTDNYRDCVLRAVTLGEDTDTVAAIAGGLAGIKYGEKAVPREWFKMIPRIEWIQNLCELFDNRFSVQDSRESSG